MKVIFLDVDGVLNFESCSERLNGFYFVEDSRIELLKQIVDATGAKIVLSSSWRSGWYDQDEGKETIDLDMYKGLIEKLNEHNLKLIDKTGYDLERGDEIQTWLNEWTEEPVEAFVIIDDLSGRHFHGIAEHLVQTSWKHGLQEKHVRKAIEILNTKERKR